MMGSLVMDSIFLVLCWWWCWNFKWMMHIGFYCMIGRIEISGLWRMWLHL